MDGLAMESGLTKVMIETIKRPVLWWRPNGDPGIIGNPSGVGCEIWNRCMARMCAMTKLCVMVIQTESVSYTHLTLPTKA